MKIKSIDHSIVPVLSFNQCVIGDVILDINTKGCLVEDKRQFCSIL
jgi:hypothetical protein